MSEEFSMEISIPADNDGYILLQCPICGEYFKITTTDYKDERVLNLFCPACGLFSENYFTDDVLELAQAMVKNYANNLLYEEMKKWEKQLKGSFVSFKAGKKPDPEPEIPIKSGIDALSIAHFPCCVKSAKVKTILKITGCYCPFCGVKDFEVE